jgi:hypothetical protein
MDFQSLQFVFWGKENTENDEQRQTGLYPGVLPDALKRNMGFSHMFSRSAGSGYPPHHININQIPYQ